MLTSEILIQKFLKIFFSLLYNSFAWSYDFVAFIVSMGMWNRWVLSVLPYLTGSRILELGFGPGHLQTAIRNGTQQTVGLDKSFSMVKIARKRVFANGFVPYLIQGTAKKIPFPSNWFDQVVATFPSEYLMKLESLREIIRVLKPDGNLIILPVAWITEKTFLARSLALLFRVTKQAPVWDENLYHDTFFAPLKSAGFNSMEMKKISYKSSEVLVIISTKKQSEEKLAHLTD